jgi:hypothetical protein
MEFLLYVYEKERMNVVMFIKEIKIIIKHIIRRTVKSTTPILKYGNWKGSR